MFVFSFFGLKNHASLGNVNAWVLEMVLIIGHVVLTHHRIYYQACIIK